jgi:hypothetical protein
MFVHGLLSGFSRLYTLKWLFQYVASLLLGGTTLYWVVAHIDLPDGTAVVHVIEPEVEVILDGQSFNVLRAYSVIECSLPAGRHRLCMKRDDRILYEEWFIMRPGEDVVLTAYHRR